MRIKIGKLYMRCHASYSQIPDIVVVTGKKKVNREVMIEFYYLDDPDEQCVWNTAAFKDGMNELDVETPF